MAEPSPRPARETDSERQYRLLVELSPYCIHQIDLEGRLLSMNAKGLEMMGVASESEVVGTLYLDAVATPDRPRIETLMAAALQGEPARFEFEAVNGRVFASSFIPIFDDAGRVVRLMGMTQDVTEQRRAEQRLRESEQRLELALRGARQGLWDLDVPSGSLVVNEGWARMFGYTVAELRPHVETLWSMCHPNDKPAVRRRLRDHFEGRTAAFESTHRMRSRKGEWRWIVDRATIVERDADGNPLRLTGTTLDITAAHEAEKRQRELEAQLQQAQKMESIGQLAGGIAHDFNNLLTVISGNVGLALEDLEAGNSPRGSLEEIQRAAEHAGTLVHQLLAFSRVRPVQLAPVDLNELLGKLLTMVARVLPESIELELEPSVALPLIEADAAQLEQIVLNLCVNARDAMPDGGTLTLATRSGDGRVTLTVTDTGCGMDGPTRDRAFDPFFTTKHRQGGSGLGLAMVYASVQQHGGSVRLDSEPGRGTTVTVHFPATDRLPSAADRPTAEPDHRGGETVLVVEDEEMVRALAERMLERAGYTVLSAGDGVEGLELFEQNAGNIDLVLLDVIMPRANGVETFESIQRLDPAVPVLFTSGYNQDNTLPPELLQRGDLQVLPKPYDSQALLARIRAVLDAP